MAKMLDLPEHSVAIVFYLGDNDNIVGGMAKNVEDTEDDGKLIALGTGVMAEVFKNISEYVDAGLQVLRKSNSVLDAKLKEIENTRALLADVKGSA